MSSHWNWQEVAGTNLYKEGNWNLVLNLEMKKYSYFLSELWVMLIEYKTLVVILNHCPNCFRTEGSLTQEKNFCIFSNFIFLLLNFTVRYIAETNSLPSEFVCRKMSKTIK